MADSHQGNWFGLRDALAIMRFCYCHHTGTCLSCTVRGYLYTRKAYYTLPLAVSIIWVLTRRDCISLIIKACCTVTRLTKVVHTPELPLRISFVEECYRSLKLPSLHFHIVGCLRTVLALFHLGWRCMAPYWLPRYANYQSYSGAGRIPTDHPFV